MVKRIIEKIGLVVLAALLSLLAGYFILSRTEKGNEMFYKEQSIDIELDKKADKGYVDQQDNILKANIDENKADNIRIHEKDYTTLKDLIDTGQKSNDDNFDHIIRLIEAQHD